MHKLFTAELIDISRLWDLKVEKLLYAAHHQAMVFRCHTLQAVPMISHAIVPVTSALVNSEEHRWITLQHFARH